MENENNNNSSRKYNIHHLGVALLIAGLLVNLNVIRQSSEFPTWNVLLSLALVIALADAFFLSQKKKNKE